MTLPFQAVLNEVLPQTTDQNAAHDAARQGANPAADALAGQDFGKAAADAAPGGKQPVQAPRISPIDPTFQITKQAGPGATTGDLGQKFANNELAFAARVVQRAGTAATAALRDPGTVISASRFDTPKPAAGAPVDTATAKKSDAPAPQAKLQAGQPVQAADAKQADANGGHSGGEQHDSTPQSAAETLHPASGPEETATSTVQEHDAGNSTGIAAPVAVAAGSHSPGAAKAATDSSGPQLNAPESEAPSRPGESVRDISLRLTNAEQGSVQVRLSERAGELHISVRTPDVGLTRGLRDGLPDLMGRLQVNGYRAETWQPGGNGSNAGQGRSQDAPANGGSQQRQGGGGQQQPNSQNQQHQQDEHTPQWVREMESSIQRSHSQWPASSTR